MSEQNQFLEEQPLGRVLYRYVVPSVLALFMNGAYQLCDAFFVGRYVGVSALAALNLSLPFVFILFSSAIMIAVGGMALFSIAQGARKQAEAKIYLIQTFWLLGGGAAVFFCLSAVGLPQILGLLGAKEPTLYDQAFSYAHVFGVGCLSIFLGIGVPILIRNDHSPKFATFLLVAGALGNIALDALFVGYFDFGLSGAAWASVVAQTVVGLVGVGYFFSRWATYRLEFFDFSLVRFGLWGGILKNGLPTFLMQSYFSAVTAVHNHLFLDYGSYQIVALFSVCGYLMWLNYTLAEGLSAGIQPLISYFYGAGSFDKIRKIVLFSTIVCFAFGVGYVLLINVFAAQILDLFLDLSPELKQAGIHGIRLHLFSIFFDSYLVLVACIFQAVSAPKIANMLSIGNILVQVPLLFGLPLLIGLDGVWLAMPLSNLLIGGIAIVAQRRFLRDLSISPTEKNLL